MTELPQEFREQNSVSNSHDFQANTTYDNVVFE